MGWKAYIHDGESGEPKLPSSTYASVLAELTGRSWYVEAMEKGDAAFDYEELRDIRLLIDDGDIARVRARYPDHTDHVIEFLDYCVKHKKGMDISF